ncbi:YcaO-like family protein [Candidatus Magnetominusculus xianensis]|uniref:YcaO-like domain protein n=1 Tax=Candidatus Magnetominusculus xianensis TaxID=1748249 RepID=A0ABR5SLJ7_9BACT|nr:YcaO-like family protein [Candidatus Magnetominusculus xianensis]KWT94651.1 YcaO-like domain protein [Candidatus Magnetominusculus xianensis]MBF0403363.1 YcaO-like family protein [Nitrospirota bacterium]
MDSLSPSIVFCGQHFREQKHYWYGTQRSISPKETYETIKPYFKEIGLTRLANITGLDRIGIHTVLAIRPNSYYLSVDAGKGFTLEAAEVSAAMECIERCVGEQAPLREILLSYKEISSLYGVIPVENLPFTNKLMFSENRTERWTTGYDIINRQEVAVPYVSVSMRGPHGIKDDLHTFMFGSNGLASGNTFLEAVYMGLLETIERDAVTSHSVAKAYQKYHPPRADINTIRFPLVLNLLERIREAQVNVIVYDCTVDTAIPVYLAYLYDHNRNIGVFKGYGAHLDPEIALIRAITEAVQGRLVYISGSRDDFFRNNLTGLKLSDNDRQIALLESVTPTIDMSGVKSESTDTFEEDILICLERLKRVGLNQVIVFDLTPEGYKVNVVRVVVPGLEGYTYKYYSPGRRALNFADQRMVIS